MHASFFIIDDLHRYHEHCQHFHGIDDVSGHDKSRLARFLKNASARPSSGWNYLPHVSCLWAPTPWDWFFTSIPDVEKDIDHPWAFWSHLPTSSSLKVAFQAVLSHLNSNGNSTENHENTPALAMTSTTSITPDAPLSTKVQVRPATMAARSWGCTSPHPYQYQKAGAYDSTLILDAAPQDHELSISCRSSHANWATWRFPSI